jgi:hypothetical protein
MSSPQLHTPSIQVRHDERAAGAVNEQQSPRLNDTGKQARSRRASRSRRIAIATAVAIGLGAGAGAIVPSTSHAPETISQSRNSALPAPVPHLGATSASFVRRVGVLEARGYVQIACKTDGLLMFNPRTHSYEAVRAESRSARVLSVGETSQSFVRRIRVLEARGYVEVACQVGGERMFNPRTHSSKTVRV